MLDLFLVYTISILTFITNLSLQIQNFKIDSELLKLKSSVHFIWKDSVFHAMLITDLQVYSDENLLVFK